MVGDRFIRSMLVLSGLSPVFLLWAVRGVQDVSGNLWAGICLMLFVIPSAAMKIVIRSAKLQENIKVIVPSQTEVHQEQLLTYLLAMLLPLIEVSFNGLRNALAGLLSLTFTSFLFYKMELHYMNLFFLLIGYRIFELHVETDVDGCRSLRFVVIPKRRFVEPGSRFAGYRLGGNVLMEVGADDRQSLRNSEDKDD